MGVFIGGAIVIAFAVWTVVAPRQQWLVLNAWRYRDPEANEPSDLSYTLGRVAGVGVIVAVLVGAVLLIRAEHSPERAAADARKARQQRFGTASVKLVATPPAGRTGTPIAIWRYATPDDRLLTDVGGVPAGADLIIAVDGAYRADAVAVEETGDRVTVTLRGRCVSTAPELLCDQARTQALPPLTLFPLDLRSPLGKRALVDGSTGAEAIGR